MDDATAALFPDSMEESEIGPIPKGWEVTTLAKIVQISKKTVNPQLSPTVKFNHYSIPAFDSGRYPDVAEGETIHSGKFILDIPSILVSKLNPKMQRIWTVPNPQENSVCSTEFIVLNAISEDYFSFINQMVRGARFQESFIGMATGSTGSRQRVRPDEILRLPVVIPGMPMIQAFSKVTNDSIHNIDLMKEQIQVLKEIRDSLLPKLIAGELQFLDEEVES